MHELSITQSIVEAIVERMGGTRISAVRLEIGKLSGVLVDSVRFCFDLVAEGTTVQGARLVIDEPAGGARCRDCTEEFDVEDPIVLCPACGSADAEVLSGRELRIKSVEVSSACAPPAGAPTTPEYG
ncbi:hydrogenase maturation nickel metallochaperone HypA [Allokutzneria albata]|uniref:Hydrogenase maturation factor HypA n=1 Tax=Allokutzneria albata TaxID=211114 RepID=A0A1G9WDA7_ALLAB|nr:hydrogenase maturation nickel metallochaperone HypA [Allokutzneria albata]SDM82201.1 Hydrogenase-3 nickel incorporation protein HypA [Allokutzneria albata]